MGAMVVVNKISAATFGQIGKSLEEQKYVMGEPRKPSQLTEKEMPRKAGCSGTVEQKTEQVKDMGRSWSSVVSTKHENRSTEPTETSAVKPAVKQVSDPKLNDDEGGKRELTEEEREIMRLKRKERPK